MPVLLGGFIAIAGAPASEATDSFRLQIGGPLPLRSNERWLAHKGDGTGACRRRFSRHNSVRLQFWHRRELISHRRENEIECRKDANSSAWAHGWCSSAG